MEGSDIGCLRSYFRDQALQESLQEAAMQENPPRGSCILTYLKTQAYLQAYLIYKLVDVP